MVFQNPPPSCQEANVSDSLCKGQGLSCAWHLLSTSLKEVRCFWAFSRATLAPSSSVAWEKLCQADPSVSKALAMLLVLKLYRDDPRLLPSPRRLWLSAGLSGSGRVWLWVRLLCLPWGFADARLEIVGEASRAVPV